VFRIHYFSEKIRECYLVMQRSQLAWLYPNLKTKKLSKYGKISLENSEIFTVQKLMFLGFKND